MNPQSLLLEVREYLNDNKTCELGSMVVREFMTHRSQGEWKLANIPVIKNLSYGAWQLGYEYPSYETWKLAMFLVLESDLNWDYACF